MTPAIVKLGGSLLGSPRLRAWLDALTDAGPVVLVPGGGPFAEAVRTVQGRIGLDHRVAHQLALLAMEQTARALGSLCPGLQPASGCDAIAAALAESATPIWLPSAMALAAPDLPASWEVTSDSLAAWLAGALGSDRLLLVKSLPTPAGPTEIDVLARDGAVDAAFPGFLRRIGCPAWWVGPDEPEAAARALRDGGAPGSRILV